MKHKITFIGIVLSALYILLILVANWPIWEEIRNLELNALGDFLAGTFGPLTLLWLILSFIQQQHELQATTEALKLQTQELQHSVEQYTVIADATNQQLHLATVEHRLSTLPNFKIVGAGAIGWVDRVPDQFRILIKNLGMAVWVENICSSENLLNLIKPSPNTIDKDDCFHLTWYANTEQLAPSAFTLSIYCVLADGRKMIHNFSMKQVGDQYIHSMPTIEWPLS